MGNLSSSDTRRISFSNSIAFNPAYTIEKAIEDNETAIDEINKVIEDLNVIPAYNDVAKEDVIDNVAAGDFDIDYWSQRLENLKQEHENINKIIETEYQKTIEINRDNYEVSKEVTPPQLIKPCSDFQLRIRNCYEENPNQTLACSPLVQEFAKVIAANVLNEQEPILVKQS